jgi:type I restriction enzyme S subunit
MRLEFDPQEICSNEYANYALNSEGGVARLRALATGTTSVAAIYTRDLLRMLFVVPPPTEQGAIAGALSDVDALIGALDQLIAKKRDLKQASMQQLLTGQKRLPGFSGDWEVKRLATVCAMKSGQGITDANIDGFSKFPCYGGNGLRGFTSRFTHNGCHALIGRQGALCGNVLSVEGMFFASEHAIVVTAFPQTDIHWLAYVLEKMRLNQYSESSAQPGLSVAKLLNLDLAVPPSKGEQTAIAEVLSDMDAEIAALERRRDKTRALKQGMMQELLTGRTRLVDSPRSYGQERL